VTGLEVALRRRLQAFELTLELRAERGILALFGRSGVGKTQTLECIAGLVRPDQGEVTLAGRVLFRDRPGEPRVEVAPRARRVGYVPQDGALFPHMSLVDNVGYARRKRPAEARRLAQGLLDEMDIGHLAGRWPDEVSGGQRRRAAIARALAADPEVLLLDEPFVHLDRVVRDKLIADLVHLVEERRIPALLVTHDIEVVVRAADRMVVLEDGKVVQAGPVEAVLFQPATGGLARLFADVNLLDGRVVGAADGLWQVQAAGGTWRLPWVGPLTAGERVEVAVRASAVKLVKPGVPLPPELAANRHPATLVGVMRRPDIVRLTFDLGGEVELGGLVSAELLERSRLSPGQACEIAVVLDGLGLFRPERG